MVVGTEKEVWQEDPGAMAEMEDPAVQFQEGVVKDRGAPGPAD